jgi:hypothetical protein
MCKEAALGLYISGRNIASLANFGTTEHCGDYKLAHVTQCRPSSGRDYDHHGGEIRYL